MIDLKDLTREQLTELITDLGEPRFRAGQIYEWLYRGAESFDDMTNISKATREKLARVCFVSKPVIKEKYVSRTDGTVKYLFGLDDGNCIETVVMEYKHGLSVCVSSQVGCRMGCGFCASTIGGLVRSLTAGEIINQIIFAQKDLGKRIGHVVMMGIGEPLDNFDNVKIFLKNANDEKGLGISFRSISLSTCGLVPRIYELAELELPITLCISLHAPNDEIRDKIMPVNHSYKINEVMTACRDYIKRTSRRITFEYSLIRGVNDSTENADELAELIGGMLCHVNLIPVNEVKERSYIKSTRERVKAFCDRLNKNGINATVRRELGSDISASCGQLRRQHEAVIQQGGVNEKRSEV